MRKVAFVSALSAVLGYAAVHVAFFARSTPTCAPEGPAVEAPAAPAVLAAVVEVNDPAALLDHACPVCDGVPFDPQVTPAGHTAPAGAPPIPKATDDEPAADPGRVMWYGPHRLPKQIGGGADPAEVVRGLRTFAEGQRPVYGRGVTVGVGLYF